jgi:hypothetical protein
MLLYRVESLGKSFKTLDAAIEAAKIEAAEYTAGTSVDITGPRPAETAAEKAAIPILGERVCLASVDHRGRVTRRMRKGGYVPER